jgi:predicted DNA-binding transcriptional regulator AlpA
MQILSLDEAAKRLNICRRSLERAIASGSGPAVVRITPRRIGIVESILDAWIAERCGLAAGLPIAPVKRGRGRPRKLPETKSGEQAQCLRSANP